MDNAECLLQLTSQKQGNFTYEVLLLCCCAIDALGNLFLVDDQRDDIPDGKQFRELLWRYGTFKGFDFGLVNAVKLLQKVQEYERVKGARFPTLITYISSDIAKHDYPTGNAWKKDLSLGQVKSETEPLIRSDGHPELIGWLRSAIDKATHAGVLYEQYRCAAVHEMRVGNHWAGSRDPLPFYMGVIDGGVDFTFPEHYLIPLVRSLLDTLLERCRASVC